MVAGWETEMSNVIAAPELISAAASDVAGIGSSISAANVAAAPDHRGDRGRDDEVSAAIASLFSSHGQEFQAVSAYATAFHDQFVAALSGAGGAYAAAEAASVSPLQSFEQAASGIPSGSRPGRS